MHLYVFFYIYRARFESLSSQLFQNCVNPVQKLLDKCGVEAADVDKVQCKFVAPKLY